MLGDRPPTAGDLPALTYLDGVVNETLRLFPPAVLSARVPVEDFEYGGHRVPAGAMVLYSPYVTHRMPDVPLPDVDGPSIPWPDVPWPDVAWPDLPDVSAPPWLRAILVTTKFWVPIVVAVVVAVREVRRRRRSAAQQREQAGAGERDHDGGDGEPAARARARERRARSCAATVPAMCPGTMALTWTCAVSAGPARRSSAPAAGTAGDRPGGP